MVRECGGGGKKISKGLGKNDAGAAATRHVKATARDDPTASTTGRFSINTVARVIAPIEPPDQAKLMTRYILAARGGV